MQCLAVHLPQSHIAGMENLNFWERLKALGNYSQERRRERYLIIFICKLAMGLNKGYNMDFSPRRGWTAVPKHVELGAPARVRRAREGSLAVKGAVLFNLCPRGLRDMAFDHQDRFKENLDAWLHDIPDQPTIPGCQRAALTNSLLHQVPLMLQEFENHWFDSTDVCFLLFMVNSCYWKAYNVML